MQLLRQFRGSLFTLVLLGFSMVLTPVFGQWNFTVSGKVTNEKGQALAAVNVFEVGVTNLAVTNANGEYSISIVHSAAILRYSFSGYEMQETKVTGTAIKNIILKPASNDVTPETAAAAPMGEKYDPLEVYDVNSMGIGEVVAKSGGVENPFLKAAEVPNSPFSVNVDGPAYSNIYRYAKNAEMPFVKMVRIEEMINYFQYDYPQPEGKLPFSITTELSECPWNTKHQLLMIGLQGREIDSALLPSSNLVFLIDASGSMKEAMKLPLVKASLKLLAKQLRPQDKVSIVAYAGDAGVILAPTKGSDRATIEKTIDQLEPAGATAGAAGIKLAYATAKQHFIKGGNNRIILCTDGDFNVGLTDAGSVDSLIETERKTGVFLSVLGFGNGQHQNRKMKRWAEKGNGNHHYIGGLNEARKIFINEYASTIFTIAKDVKPLVQFNPAKVQAYRLIGYDTKDASKGSFSNDMDDAGELGSGHTVTALYEIIPPGVKNEFEQNNRNTKFVTTTPAATNTGSELANLQFRYKNPGEEESQLITKTISANATSAEQASNNFRFAAAVAEFGLLLRGSDYMQKASYKNVLALAKKATAKDGNVLRKDFITIVEDMKKVARQME